MSRRRPFPPWLAFIIAARDGWKCHVDGLGLAHGETWEIDHDIPLAKGGTNHLRNLRLCHGRCNRDKAAA